MKKILRTVRGRSVLDLVAEVVTLASLVFVAVMSAPHIAEWMGDEWPAFVLAGAVVLVLDVLWLTGLYRLPAAIAARDWLLVTLAGGLTLAGGAASAWMVAATGGHPLGAYVPVVALALRAVALAFALRTPDADTRSAVTALEAEGRNRRALMDAHVRHLTREAELTALEETAATLARAQEGRARALALSSAQVVRMKTTAEVRERLDTAAKKTGTDIPALPVAEPASTPAQAVSAALARRPATGSDTGAAPVRSGSVPSAPTSPDTGGTRFTPGRSEAELEAKGWEIYRTLQPRTWTAFKAAMRDADHGAADTRLKPVWESVRGAATEAVVDALREDVAPEELDAE